MNATCTECGTVFRVDPAKVPADGVRARCSVCGGVFSVEPPAERGEAFVDGLGEQVAEPSPPAAALVAVGPAPDDARAVPRPAQGPAAPPVDAAPAPAVAIAGGRPFNPYLNNSPELRARRLARALVSDLVAYNPQKREQGLRDGTLRQLFRDEVRKSWEEYVEQVGSEIAESTPHFQDALNDVLAGGRRVF